MKELELSPRLRALGAQVPQGAKLADVGTDHAYLPVSLLLDGRITQAVASDVNEGPFSGAGRQPGPMGWRKPSPFPAVMV